MVDRILRMKDKPASKLYVKLLTNHDSMLTPQTQSLDIQYTVGIATDVPVVFISVGSENTDGIFGFLDEANYLLNETDIPNVLTTSYGYGEAALGYNVA